MSIIRQIQTLGWSLRHPLSKQEEASGHVHVFHHLPKCGGTSLLKVLGEWFILVKDYQTQWNRDYPPRTPLAELTSRHCLCGHFEEDGYRLRQRYPEVFTSSRYRVFTFIRDPLAVKLSLHRYETENRAVACGSVEECLLSRTNYLASLLQASENDYRQILDRYFFVGILEEAQESLDLLASLLGRKCRHMPYTNRTRTQPGTTASDLPAELVAQFRECNRLDYLIYDYCKERFAGTRSEQAP